MKQVYVASYFRNGYSRFMKYVHDVLGHPKRESIERRMDIIQFFEEFGAEATRRAFGKSRSTVYLWKQKLKKASSQLSAQFPIPPLRVVYSASGTLPAAAFIADPRGIVEHKLYWTSVDTELEGRYLLAILNSETARKSAEHLQGRGQWGARDFDKVMLSLPIPTFDRAAKLHRALARAAKHAEEVAGIVEIPEGMHFIQARQRVRTALREDGVADKVDKLVAELLGASSEIERELLVWLAARA